MAIGSINSFPINTILEFATSGQFGLCPQLSGSIEKLLVNTDANNPVSELGIRKALDAINTSIQYQNLGTGVGIYSTLSAPTAYYNTISGTTSDYILGYLDGNTLVLSAYAEPEVTGSTSPTMVTSNFSVQGGKYQYSNTIQASAITTSGYTLAKAEKDDVIGKIFINCKEPLDNNSQLYKIGLSGDEDAFAYSIIPPSAVGLVEGWEYGFGLTGEYYWIPSDTDIKIYRYDGSDATSGQLGISIFYDQVEWSPNYGYAYNRVYGYERYNLTNNVYEYRHVFIPNFVFNNAHKYNSKLYIAGGGIGNPITEDDIHFYETKNDTISPQTRSDLLVARGGIVSQRAVSTVKAYLAVGGYVDTSSYTMTNTIENITFANDTATATNNVNLNTIRQECATCENNTSMYVAGGWSARAPGNELASVEKMDFATDNSISAIASFTNERVTLRGYKISNDYIYWSPGIKLGSGPGQQLTLNEITKTDTTTDTHTDISDPFIILERGDTGFEYGHQILFLPKAYGNDTARLVQKYSVGQKYNATTNTMSVFEYDKSGNQYGINQV